MASCSAVFGLVMLVVVLIGCAVSLGTSYWLEGTQYHSGLWQECHGPDDKCEFIKVNSTNLPKWFNPVRVVSAVSAANAVVAILVAMGYLCCSCCRYSIRAVQFLILVLVVGCLELSLSVVVYAVKRGDLSGIPDTVKLGWSFYLACASALLFIVNIFFFVCETSNARARIQYQPIYPSSHYGGTPQENEAIRPTL